MRTATFATMTALAALLVAAPGVSTHDAEAKIRTVGKVINKGPRIRVRPRIKVNLNTKRLIDENRKTRTLTNPSAQATTQTAKKIPNRISTTTRVSLFPQHDAAQRLAFEERHPDFSSAIEDLEGIIGAEGLGDFDVEGLAKLDVAAYDPLGTGDDDSGSPIPPGFESALTDPSDTGEIDALDPSTSLPEDTDKPDSSHVRVNVDNARNGVANNGNGDTSQPGQSATTFYKDHGNGVHSVTIVEQIHRASDPERSIGVIQTTETYDEDGLVRSETLVKGPDELRRTVSQGPLQNHTTYEPVARPSSEDTGADPTKLYDPGYVGGGEVIPPNCGSYDCNEARKGHKLNPGVTTTGTHVNPGPEDSTQGIVAQAPRANEKYREKAITNPGTEPQDEGNGNGPVGEHTPILVIGGG